MQTMLADDFFDIIENNEIINWETKDFWKKIDHSQYKDEQNLQQQIYKLISLLAKNSCFDVKRSEKNKRLKIYTENKKLKRIRNLVIQDKLNEVLEEKYNSTLEEINLKENELKFILSLLEENPSFKSILDNHHTKYKNELYILKSKINVMTDIKKHNKTIY